MTRVTSPEQTTTRTYFEVAAEADGAVGRLAVRRAPAKKYRSFRGLEAGLPSSADYTPLPLGRIAIDLNCMQHVEDWEDNSAVSDVLRRATRPLEVLGGNGQMNVMQQLDSGSFTESELVRYIVAYAIQQYLKLPVDDPTRNEHGMHKQYRYIKVASIYTPPEGEQFEQLVEAIRGRASARD